MSTSDSEQRLRRLRLFRLELIREGAASNIRDVFRRARRGEPITSQDRDLVLGSALFLAVTDRSRGGLAPDDQ